MGSAWAASGLVFTTSLGGWIDPNNFGRLMDALVEPAGVPRITPKGLRHTAQSVGRVVVGDDKVMQERLGHADHRHHPRYLHPHRSRTAPPGRRSARPDLRPSATTDMTGFRFRKEGGVADTLVVVRGAELSEDAIRRDAMKAIGASVSTASPSWPRRPRVRSMRSLAASSFASKS